MLFQDDTPTKLFIGRLSKGTTIDDLKECFSEYGPLKDVYIPTTFRGFGFVTFGSQAAAREVLNSSHVIKVVFLIFQYKKQFIHKFFFYKYIFLKFVSGGK